MLRIQSTALPPSRVQNTVREGGLWYSEKQNEIVSAAKEVINQPIKKQEGFILRLRNLTVKQGTKLFWLAAFGSVITTFIYHLIFI